MSIRPLGGPANPPSLPPDDGLPSPVIVCDPAVLALLPAELADAWETLSWFNDHGTWPDSAWGCLRRMSLIELSAAGATGQDELGYAIEDLEGFGADAETVAAFRLVVEEAQRRRRRLSRRGQQQELWRYLHSDGMLVVSRGPWKRSLTPAAFVRRVRVRVAGRVRARPRTGRRGRLALARRRRAEDDPEPVAGPGVRRRDVPQRGRR